MSNLLPKSRIVRVELSISLPISATLDQVEEWAAFELGRGGMAGDNPLGNYGLEAIADPILTDTRRHLHSEAIDNQDGTFQIRRWEDQQPAWGPTAIETVIASRRKASDAGTSNGE